MRRSEREYIVKRYEGRTSKLQDTCLARKVPQSRALASQGLFLVLLSLSLSKLTWIRRVTNLPFLWIL